MKYGFLTDVHGDLEGLQRALNSLGGADAVYCLGDLAGGREVDECVELLRSQGIQSVKGNHDLWEFELEGLSESSQDFQRSLPLELQVDDWLAVHSDYEIHEGQPRFPYIYSQQDAQRAFQHFPERLVFFGHTHLSQVHRLNADGSIDFFRATETAIQLDPQSRYLINIAMAAKAVALYDSEQQSLSYIFFEKPRSEPITNPTKAPLWTRLKQRLGL
jgi:predicted phosphodiesterase